MNFFNTKELDNYIKNLYEKVRPLAEQDGVYFPLSTIFIDDKNMNDQGTYCYADSEGYHYYIAERGEINRILSTVSLFEIAYKVLSNQYFQIACTYEASHRVKNQDFRRLYFAKYLQYFTETGQNIQISIINILRKH